jgi:hypothetical protein
VARACPGLGNPIDLVCGEFEAHLVMAAKGSGERTDEGDWMRRYVEGR